ncbi:MAG: GntR family transcriptional regulator [Granulosicoccus sp.]|nr:GntR family transcriptional regulator [Granulosicoccus sp.]
MTKEKDLTIPDMSTGSDRTTQEYVYGRIRHAIMIGAIPPGTVLTMRGLADTMGLSPTPIREAVRRLSSVNAIQVNKSRRLSIPEMTSGRFEELVALRITLEKHAAERALPYVSDIKITTMTGLDDEMDNAIVDNDWDRLTILNHDFHRTLYTVNPDQVTLPVIESIWLQLGPFQRQALEMLKEFYTIDRHKEILAALATRDATALVKATEYDIRDSIYKAGRKLLTAGAAAA